MDTIRSADGVTIAFERSGEGPPLIVVTGAFNDRTTPSALVARLGQHFKVYAYDRRGRGDSQDASTYSIERETDDLAAVAAAAGGSPAVFGHSSGGSLALEAAARGLSFAGLAVYEPPYVPGTTNAFADELASLAAAGRAADAAERFLLSTGLPAAAVEQAKAGPDWARLTSFARTLPYDVRLANEGVVPAGRLGAIAVPVLALAGGASPAWARDGAAAISAAIPGGSSVVLPDQTHRVDPQVLVPVLAEFFRVARA
jgi:pimeloyl-ACP methyl ester carboxylesterase